MMENNSSNIKDADKATIKKKTSRHSSSAILSPHLGIYRWEVTMLISILHRFSGIALWVAAVVGVLLASNQLLFGFFTIGDNVLLFAQDFSYIILLPLFFALVFHGLNGIRHFFWDVGVGYDIKVARVSAWLVLILSLVATLSMAIWWWSYS